MKLQKFIEVLEKEDTKASNFFKKNGKDIFQSPKLLEALLDLKWSEKKMVH